MKPLRQAIDNYIALRRSLGFKLCGMADDLRKFVSFMEQKAAALTVEIQSPLTSISTGCATPGCSSCVRKSSVHRRSSPGRLMGRADEAVIAYDRALAILAADAETWDKKGLALDRAARTGEALAAFEQALALFPEYSAAWVHKGAMLEKLERFEGAVAAYDRALQIDPEAEFALRQIPILKGRLTSAKCQSGSRSAVPEGIIHWISMRRHPVPTCGSRRHHAVGHRPKQRAIYPKHLSKR